MSVGPSAMQPAAHRGQQLLGIHGLGQIIRGARIEAFLPVALHRFGGKRDDRQPSEAGSSGLPHRLIAVHLRHHDIHQDDGDVGVGFDQLDRLAPGGGGQHPHAAPFEHAAQREDIARVIVNEQHRAADQILVGAVSRSSIRCFSAGRSVTTRCRNSAVSSSRRSGDSTPLTTMLRAMVCSRASSSARQFASGENDNRDFRQRRVCAATLPELQSPTCREAAGRAPRSRRLPSRSASSASSPVPAVSISISSWPSNSEMLMLLGGIVFNDEQALTPRRRNIP